jgi:hypothetical protein
MIATTHDWVDLTSFFFLANFTKPLKYSNSLGIMRMVSMGVKKIFPLTKCYRIFNLMLLDLPQHLKILCSSSCNFPIPTLDVDACIGNLHIGILTLEKTLCLTPHSRFNLVNVASSSLTSTSRKFAEANGPLPFFFQHLSYVCPMLEQKEHLKS